MNKIFLTGLLALLLLTAACTTNEKIKIGVVAPLTGGPALWGQGSLNMIRLAAHEINANGGVNGAKIKIIAENGKCNSKAATKATQKLLRVNNVDYILGGHCSPETVAMVPIIDKANAFMLAGVTAADGAVNESSRAFRTSPPTIEQATQITNIAERRSIDTIATITEQASYAESFTQDVVATYNGTVVSRQTYQPDATDFKTQLLRIRNANPEAIWISPQDPSTAVALLQDMKELNMLNKTLIGNTIFVSENVDTSSNGLLPNDAFTVTLGTNKTTRAFNSLQTRYHRRYNESIPYNDYYVGAAYDATHMLADAIERCEHNVACVQRYFANLREYKGAVGTYTFKENGDPIFNNWRIQRIKNGSALRKSIQE